MADKSYPLDKDSGGVIPVSQVENDGGTDSVTVKGNSTSGAMYVEEKDSAGNSMNDGAGNKNVVLKDSIPAGSNIIGQVQLTDGTDGLAIDSNGNINIVPVNSSGTSLVDANGNLKVSVNGSNVLLTRVTDFLITAGSDGFPISRLDTIGYSKIYIAVISDSSSSGDFEFRHQFKNSGVNVVGDYVSQQLFSPIGFRNISTIIEIPGEEITCKIINTDTADHYYDVHVMGVK